MFAKSKGERALRPGGEGAKSVSDGWWEFINKCWSEMPGERPSADVILLFIKAL